MAEYSRLAKGHVTTLAAGGTGLINLPFQPDTVKWWNYTAMTTPTDGFVVQGYWDSSMGQGFSLNTIVATTGTTPAVTALTTSLSSTGGVSTFAAGILLQYAARKQVVAATKGATTSFQVTAHGYAVGDTVVFEGLYQTSTTGMPQMAGPQMTIITITDANNFIVNWNSNNSSYTNLSASPSGAFVKKVLYPFLYVPQVSVITAISTGTTTSITTADYHNFTVGQEVAFRIPANWGTTQLNSLPNNLIPGQPVYGYVISVTDNWTFVVNINSTGYTAFTTAVAVASVPGLSFPQVLAVGDVNTGGVQISSGSNLYPSPVFPTGSGGSSTINGPAIQGSFVNNTSQGFLIGLGGAPTASQVIYWEATLHDYSLN